MIVPCAIEDYRKGMNNVEQVPSSDFDKENSPVEGKAQFVKGGQQSVLPSDGVLEEGLDSRLMEKKRKMQPKSVVGFTLTVHPCSCN